MRKAIVTGFEPFGPYKFNPVQDTAQEFNKKTLGNIEIYGLVLPCTYYGAFNVLSKEIDRLCPDTIVSAGLASRVQRIRLESVGRNIMNGKYPDAEGKNPKGEPILMGEDLWYPTNADNVQLANFLYEAGIPSEISVDAEGFICNSLIYLTARRISREKLPIKFAFIHTPWTTDYLDRIKLESGKISIKKEDLRKTLELLLKTI